MGGFNGIESDIQKIEKRNVIIGGLVLMLFVTTLIGFYYYNFSNSYLTQESVAQFGDYIGGTFNPLLGFATVALLVWSLQIQLRELKLTRYEMEKNTKANDEQAAELKVQNDLLKNQNEISQKKQYRDEQLVLFNYLEAGLEQLFSKPIMINFEKVKKKITLEEVIFLGNTEDAKLFQRACGHTKITGEDYGCHFIIRLSLQKLEQISGCIAQNISKETFNFELLLSKVVWFSDMLLAFSHAGAIPEDRECMMKKMINNAITSSAYSDIDKQVFSEVIKD